MIPHEKELVERLSDRPFTLLGINSDSDPDRFRAQCAELGVTWPSTFEGSTREGVPLAWGVTYWPTIYVLDHEGVIRFKDVRGEEMDAAVDRLLEEMGG
ncbi:MAG: hypothetical protein QF903_08085 [Planctomycetota bacterium]|jgi:hypothetical protein|nr:hypothetical protein [Planctomycetota bacterium]MDP6761271.1 hypothetical protein [Planctomycetota bacterium]MDP6989424.1 hypothetical protein [Planctomycetota bacterium]